ncbi:MAG: PilZ domain-containing protein [Novosphingobium sp.]
MGRASNQRRASRAGVLIPATCRTATGRRGDVTIVDLTAQGCRLFTRAVPLSAGLRLRIRPQDFESLPGVVRWVRQGFAGIEFDRPLYEPVAEHLQRVFGR